MLMSEETLSTFCQSWEQKVLGCHKGRVYEAFLQEMNMKILYVPINSDMMR